MDLTTLVTGQLEAICDHSGIRLGVLMRPLSDTQAHPLQRYFTAYRGDRELCSILVGMEGELRQGRLEDLPAFALAALETLMWDDLEKQPPEGLSVVPLDKVGKKLAAALKGW